METPEEFFNNSSYVTSDFLEIGENKLGLNTDALFSIMAGYADSLLMSKVEAITENPIDNHLETYYENWFNNWMTENGHDYQDIPIDEMLTDFANHLLKELLKQ